MAGDSTIMKAKTIARPPVQAQEAFRKAQRINNEAKTKQRMVSVSLLALFSLRKYHHKLYPMLSSPRNTGASV